jgi:hypothetical protein
MNLETLLALTPTQKRTDRAVQLGIQIFNAELLLVVSLVSFAMGNTQWRIGDELWALVDRCCVRVRSVGEARWRWILELERPTSYFIKVRLRPILPQSPSY